MSLNEKKAVDIMKKSSGKNIIAESLTTIPHGFFAAIKDSDEVILVTDGPCAFADKLECIRDEYRYTARIRFAKMNAKNSQALRFFIKWTAPSSCGKEVQSIGFEDDCNMLLSFAAQDLSGENIKPVICSETKTAQELAVNMGNSAWQAFCSGLKTGYGAEYSYAKTEPEIMNALLCGYTGIVLDVAEKINAAALEMPIEEIKNQFEKQPEDFREAINFSYKDKSFDMDENLLLSYEESDLWRICICYGELIAFLQYVYNAYFKGAPWPVDFVISFADRELSPKAHYLIANELQRAGVNVCAVEIAPDSMHFAGNCKVAAKMPHKIRLLADNEKPFDLKDAKCLFDLRPAKGSGLKFLRKILEDNNDPCAELFKNTDSIDMEKIKEAIKKYPNDCKDLMQKQLQLQKNLLK